MNKFIVTAIYIDQYQLDFDPELGADWWIRKGTLYVRRNTQSEPLEFSPVVEFDGKCPDKVEIRYGDAIFSDE